jgi:hypothetical protein
MKIPAKDLDRVIQNVLEYADPKAVRLNEVLFVLGGDTLSCFSCDDYIAVTDSLEAELDSYEFALTIEDVEALGDWIKKDKKVVHKYDIILRPKMTGFIFECSETSPDEDTSDNIFLSYQKPKWESWDMVMDLLNEENDVVPFHDFAIRPERLVKLNKLKADKEAPIHIRGVDINYHLILQFRKGSTLRGAIMPVDKSYVQEEFLWPNIEA